ncbi:MAG: ligase-associated DNA damage response endonuclease PdeM [Planctomycetota bacterium]
MLQIEWSGESLQLMPQRTLFWPAASTLLMADAHLGKAATFRSAGIPVPSGTTDATLDRLESAVSTTRADRLVILGDLLHGRASRAPALLERVRSWRAAHRELEIVLVRGNHDERAGDPPADWEMRCVPEPWELPPFALCHDPERQPDAPALAGHLHPAVVVRDGRRTRLRLPCFVLGPTLGVLPAFGPFTGAHVVRPGPEDRVFAVGETVIEVTALVAGQKRGREPFRASRDDHGRGGPEKAPVPFSQ